jgi:arylsulfatase
MFGNRGIYHDGWYANTHPISPPWNLGATPNPDVANSYTWELYDLSKDWTQNNDLAAANPAKLKEMQELFLVEAARYQVLPLDNSMASRMVTPRPSVTAGRTEFTYSGELTGVPMGDAPSIIAASYTITADVEVPAGGVEGMLATQGGRFGGWGFYVVKGKPVFTWNLLDLKRLRWEGTEALAPGKHTLAFDFKYDGLGFATLAFNDRSGLGQGGTGVLKVDGKEVVTQKMEHTVPVILQWDETFDVGADTGTPVDDGDYQVPFKFTGKLAKLTIKVNRPKLTPADEQRLLRESQRSNRASE